MRKRITITFLILVISSSIITGFVSLNFQKTIYVRNLEEKVESNILLLKDLLEERRTFDKKELENLVDNYSKLIGTKIILTLKDGSLVSTHDMGIENNAKPLDILFTKTVEVKSQFITHINMTVYSRDLKEVNDTFGKYMVISIVTGLLIAFLIGLRYLEHATKPYKDITKATQSIIKGKYDEKIDFYGDKDMDNLVQNFNLMGTKLQDTIKELQGANTKLEATLTSIDNGVIAFDNSLNVILINPFAQNILNIKEDIMGKNIDEILIEDRFKEIITEVIAQGSFYKQEVEMTLSNHKVINLYSNSITSTKDPTKKIGVVLIIQDISKLRKLEMVRADFVANVSHELKTPLTSLKGFIETLKEGAIEDRNVANKFLNIMDIEVNRLNALTNDLLLLSEVENKKHDLLKELIYVEEVIDEVFQILNSKALNKSITLIKEVRKGTSFIKGNYNYFKQMMINLVDNGIKYTPPGGFVKVKAKNERDNLLIEVIDNGVGVSKEHQERIFERFYRVDKSRSRQVGGTGLGLAIVKHIVSIFNGTIKVRSQLEEGTTFIIKIPLN
ncbi:PAS domain-containing protein [Tissierella sp. MSJ-40]|uniref:histidine kinase n=1 Tax=Tissierella simiarum TaxID=2841534 RepID=A0ABS6E5P5_9FIRM|nr:ATP-binding protein [Tissierella simiarum]MBU5438161.1 PAS domain-containing protein [Tissierella simiarum]